MLAAAAALLMFMTPARADIAGIASVIDADTVEIHGQRIRLYGIDAPESCQTCTDTSGQTWRCGQRAALALQDLIGRRTVTCQRGRACCRRTSAVTRPGVWFRAQRVWEFALVSERYDMTLSLLVLQDAVREAAEQDEEVDVHQRSRPLRR
jgi:endonuclease YncB( thermonuclease family)